MAHTHSTHMAGEHSLSHQIQIGVFTFYIIVWILDSIIFRLSPLVYFVPFFLNIIPGAIIIIVALLLMQKSHMVFDEIEPKIVDTGVYAHVRHPMYLGSILLYVGLWTTSLSLLSLIPLLVVIIGYNFLASAEEKLLEARFGHEYQEYKNRVRRWLWR